METLFQDLRYGIQMLLMRRAVGAGVDTSCNQRKRTNTSNEHNKTLVGRRSLTLRVSTETIARHCDVNSNLNFLVDE